MPFGKYLSHNVIACNPQHNVMAKPIDKTLTLAYTGRVRRDASDEGDRMMSRPSLEEIFAARDRLTLDEAEAIVAPYMAERQRRIESHGTFNGRSTFAGHPVRDHGVYAECCGPVNDALNAQEAAFTATAQNIAALGMIQDARQGAHEQSGRDAITLAERIAYE